MTQRPDGGREPRANPTREKAEKPPGATVTDRRTAAEQTAEARRASAGESAMESRAERYLIAAATPLDMRGLTGQLEQDPAIHVLRTVEAADLEPLRPEGRTSRPGRYGMEFPPILVVEMSDERYMALASSPQLVVEPDRRLTYGTPLAGPASGGWYAPQIGIRASGPLVPVTVHVTDETGRALPEAVIVVDGEFATAATTGEDGKAQVRLPFETIGSVAALHVRPHDGCWSTVVVRPSLEPSGRSTVVCMRLTETVPIVGAPHSAVIAKSPPTFPALAHDSWARRALGFDRVPPNYLGRGVRIGLIDSGASERHPDLSDRLSDGRDVVGRDDKSWREDVVGQGTHCATVIAGTDDGTGIVGLAPEAELHICKVFPQGRTSDLVEALDYCIEQQLDIVQLSLGMREPSVLLAAKIDQARQAGVLCVAAAGDSGGTVAFPANLPSVLAVGAIGLLGTHPPDSCHAEQMRGAPTPEGYFAAASSDSGLGLDLCAPGVAIVGGLPPAAYGPLDGTASASAHVTAIAALALAHHPDFHTSFRVRGPQRVDHLRALILASCRPLVPAFPGGPGEGEHRMRFGAGLPDAAVAVGAATSLTPGGFVSMVW